MPCQVREVIRLQGALRKSPLVDPVEAFTATLSIPGKRRRPLSRSILMANYAFLIGMPHVDGPRRPLQWLSSAYESSRLMPRIFTTLGAQQGKC